MYLKPFIQDRNCRILSPSYRNMEIILSGLVISALFASGASSLQCYQCYVNPLPFQRYNTTPLCIHFDHSSKFIVDCPESTMCMKQEIQLEIQNGVRITNVLRNCAFQRYENQEIKNGRWSPKVEILEPYHEGCHDVDDKGEKGPRTRYCYCRNNLCNASTSSNHEGYTDIMGVIVVFNLMKYINSLR